MPRFGIIVEGFYDAAAVKEFIRKCYGTDCEVEARICAPRGGVTRQFPKYLEEFKYRSDIDKAFVVRDADRKNPVQVRAQMEAMIANRRYPFTPKFAVIVQELEAWLLADHEAVSAVTGRGVTPVPDPIEGMDSPKERLRGILSGAGVVYTAEVARKIAAAANIGRVAERCQAFRTLCQDVGDC